jgi:hypothetical protein
VTANLSCSSHGHRSLRAGRARAEAKSTLIKGRVTSVAGPVTNAQLFVPSSLEGNEPCEHRAGGSVFVMSRHDNRERHGALFPVLAWLDALDSGGQLF